MCIHVHVHVCIHVCPYMYMCAKVDEDDEGGDMKLEEMRTIIIGLTRIGCVRIRS
jgi:hypothetical protein